MGPNFLGVITAVTGVAGAACSLALWLYQSQPANSLLGSFAWEIAHGGPLRTDLIHMAFVLGIVALSYPVMAMLHTVGAPVHTALFR